MNQNFWIFILSILIIFTAKAQYAIDPKINFYPIQLPQTTGKLGDFTLQADSIMQKQTQFTSDTGPWPPDFSQPSSQYTYPVVFGGSAGLAYNLEAMVYTGDSTSVGLKWQFFGENVRDNKMSESNNSPLHASIWFQVSPSFGQGDDHFKTCILACSPEGRSWGTSTSSEEVGIGIGSNYLFGSKIKAFTNINYSHYRLSGYFYKYDNSISKTYSRDINDNGSALGYLIGISYELEFRRMLFMPTLSIAETQITSSAFGFQKLDSMMFSLILWITGLN